MPTPLISIIVPVYREEKNIAPFLSRIEPILESIGTYEILFVLDPSPDQTERVIEDHIARNPHIKLLVMSRRFGQPKAVMAGIHHARGDYVVVIDVDLQDPPELIVTMYQKAIVESCDVVYAKRIKREGETWIKKCVAAIGYKIINRFADISIPVNTGDFRIMSRRVVDELKRLKESHGFLRGLVAHVGFKQAAIEYNRDARHSGTGNYNRYLGSLRIGLNGLICFSSAPLSAILLGGVTITGLSLVTALWMIFCATTPNLMATLILFLGGIQLIAVGILGEYISRIYDEVKGRPAYIVEKVKERE